MQIDLPSFPKASAALKQAVRWRASQPRKPPKDTKSSNKATPHSPFWDVVSPPRNRDNVFPWGSWIILKCIYTIHKAFLFHKLLQALCWKISSALNLTASILPSITQASSCFLVFILAWKKKNSSNRKEKKKKKGQVIREVGSSCPLRQRQQALPEEIQQKALEVTRLNGFPCVLFS